MKLKRHALTLSGKSLDEKLMQKALEAAWAYQGLTFPNPAVGAVVSYENGEIIAVAAHQKAGEPHAEVLALKAAYTLLTHDRRITVITDAARLHEFLSKHHNGIFHNLTLHVTLEPCNHHGRTPPCSALIDAVGIKRVVVGSYDESNQAKGGGAFLTKRGVNVSFGIQKKECDALLTPFTCKENNQPFVFFKLAISLNGVATGGIITSEESRRMVHRLRDRCDLLVIGGNTVRIDRPTLDARLCNGRAPNVLIYSKKSEFDTTIPLFLVPNRTVVVSDSLNCLKESSMVMVEGGQSLLDALKNDILWYLIFQSPNLKEGKSIVLPEGLEPVFSQKIGVDTMCWYRKNNIQNS